MASPVILSLDLSIAGIFLLFRPLLHLFPLLNFIYLLFLPALGLNCCAPRLLAVAVSGIHIAVASLISEPRL